MPEKQNISLIAVGSLNPIKIAAAENVLGRVYPGARVIGIKAESRISEMPLTDDEAIRGARQRAFQSLTDTGADLGVGLEGSAATIEGKLMTAGWAAVYDGNRYGIGGGGHLLLPKTVAAKILSEKKELGTAIDELIGQENTKQKAGAIGILTRGLSTRQKAYQWILIYALAPFITPELYID